MSFVLLLTGVGAERNTNEVFFFFFFFFFFFSLYIFYVLRGGEGDGQSLVSFPSFYIF
jgi:hypothetical protein